ncbi:hypothetical protein BGW80DRAFT_799904 [Lactifluus volemus]|nr:hypothetical protein BGW80DRAFT_799904 [Lactifluus volemus]
MPPAQSPVDSQSLLAHRQHHTVNLECVILPLSLTLFFLLGSFLAYHFIINRRRATRGNAILPIFSLPDLAEGACQRTVFPTVSALIAQSTLVASGPLCLAIVPDKLGATSTLRRPMNFSCRGLERPPSWERATIGSTASTSAASIQQSSSVSPPLTSSTGNDSRPFHDATRRRLCNTRVFNMFARLRQRLLGSSAKENTDPPGHPHPSDLTDPVVDVDEPKPDIPEHITIDIPYILHSTDDTDLKTDTPVPLIILSLPSSEHLLGDLPQPVPLDEDLLSPDGTFGRPPAARAKAGAYEIDDATRMALAARLQERRRRLKSLSYPTILSTSGDPWPRWI